MKPICAFEIYTHTMLSHTIAKPEVYRQCKPTILLFSSYTNTTSIDTQGPLYLEASSVLRTLMMKRNTLNLKYEAHSMVMMV